MTTFRLATPDDRAAWDAFVAARPEADPLQSWAWGDANALVGERPVRGLLTDDDGAVRGIAQLLVRGAGFGRAVGYAPHGPLWTREAPDAGELLAALVRGLRDEAARRRVIVVKLDPRADPVTGPEGLPELLLANGLHPARHDLQARTSRIVDLLDGGDELMATWDKDARNLVRRSAREGVVTATDRRGDPAAIAAFHGLLEETSQRAGFRTRSVAFLQELASGLAPSGGWFLTLARLDDRPIAGAVALRVGDRAIYAYGASLREPALKHANGAYAALAATMRELADDGVRTLDLWGVVEPGDETADASWSGFSAFKRQFGGEPVRHPGTWDLVVSPVWHRIRDLRERLVSGRRGGG
jgi:lipid II:glycine glycyltransferase (peptidoglycan interpeptide bridge formation enzyme)